MWFIGVDVGAEGGIGIIDVDGAVVAAMKMPATDADILLALPHCPPAVCRGMLEKVHSSPQMGVASAFSFGAAYGRVRMALTAAGIPFDEVTPQRWQRNGVFVWRR